MIKLYILDVGHGSCAVLVDETDPGNKTAIIIDAGQKGTLLRFILTQKIRIIKAILISHPDQDHIGGLGLLLSGIQMPFGTIYINPDQTKDTETWSDLIVTMKKLEMERTSLRL